MIVIVLSILCARYTRARRAKIYAGIYDQNQQIYGQQMYGQPMNVQLNGQQQMKVQQQINGQQEFNENNMNMAEQNNLPSLLPVNQ